MEASPADLFSVDWDKTKVSAETINALGAQGNIKHGIIIHPHQV
jgi:hypothetical protein